MSNSDDGSDSRTSSRRLSDTVDEDEAADGLGLSWRESRRISQRNLPVAPPPPPGIRSSPHSPARSSPSVSHRSSTSSSVSRPSLQTVHSGRSLGTSSSQSGILRDGPIRNQKSDPVPARLQSSIRSSSAVNSPTKDAVSSSVGGRMLLNLNRRAASGPGKATRYSGGSSEETTTSVATKAASNVPDHQRHQRLSQRYSVDDPVLLEVQHSRWSTPVNRLGFPTGEGITFTEQQGPYLYVLCTVKQIHFDEMMPYYTLVRADNGESVRGDGIKMFPLSQRGHQAAIRASTYTIGSSTQRIMVQDEVQDEASHPCAALATLCSYLFLPFFALGDCLFYIFQRFWIPCWSAACRVTRKQSRLLLNGAGPYACRVRITLVNFVVLCSTWIMFIDQARLVMFPPSSDFVLAHVNFAVWVVLVLELVAEVFVRPDGYRKLIIGDRAYAPTTVRFINAFHLFVETLSLITFVPEFYCLFSGYRCDERLPISFYNAAYMAVTGPTRLDTFWGRAFFCLIRFRVFGLVRHWKNMWIATTFIRTSISSPAPAPPRLQTKRRESIRNFAGSITNGIDLGEEKAQDTDKKALVNASNIGTALMATNSYRALAIVWLITGIFPLLLCFGSVYHNQAAVSMTNQLQGSNLLANDNSTESCEFLANTTIAWMTGVTSPDFVQDDDDPYVVALDILPIRCSEASSWYAAICEETAVEVTVADTHFEQNRQLCEVWGQTYSSPREIADSLGLRAGSVISMKVSEKGNVTIGDFTNETEFTVNASFDETYTIRTAAFSSLLLQILMLTIVLGGLSVLRRDAEILVLGPLRRMLKIVARYAKNPLVPPKVAKGVRSRRRFLSSRGEGDNSSLSSSSDESQEGGQDQEGLALGSYETTQLITAVTRITALLRKCWGVAGADIISTNLETRKGALTEVFNPTVKGRSVYALFGFAGIDGFDHTLRNLGGDVMILINDVAAVLHGEVFRWGLHDSGQCNKNLGAAFLMVFRIGLVTEVTKKLEQATDVIFSNTTSKASGAKRRMKRDTSGASSSSKGSRVKSSSAGGVARVTLAKKAAVNLHRRVERSKSIKAMSLSLASLPGISTFTDRAVIGMLKSFAGIHRDSKIRTWNNDFRLGAGVGAFTVSLSFGMDAGWAVEGAVGSEYKIDATYLSPHVNMASRMMGAAKQYGVSIMFSQAVQELMSDVARSKLRHLDTVTVKGSLLKQKIYTYDARYKGVDFFLKSRSDEQADYDAERYAPSTWNTDPDLTAMRQHVTDDFLQVYAEGRKAYIAGDWPTAISNFEKANEIMMETVFEEGYLENELEELQLQAGNDQRAAAEALKRETGDGPSLLLIAYMKSHNGEAPPDWEGWHPLTRK